MVTPLAKELAVVALPRGLAEDLEVVVADAVDDAAENEPAIYGSQRLQK